jgi:hypothetical protein
MTHWTCTGYLEHPFKNLAVSSVIDLELLGKLTPTLTGLRTDLPSSQHRQGRSERFGPLKKASTETLHRRTHEPLEMRKNHHELLLEEDA